MFSWWCYSEMEIYRLLSYSYISIILWFILLSPHHLSPDSVTANVLTTEARLWVNFVRSRVGSEILDTVVTGLATVLAIHLSFIILRLYYIYIYTVSIKKWTLSFFLNFSIKSWSNFKIRDSFEICTFSAFQNCPWFWNLTN